MTEQHNEKQTATPDVREKFTTTLHVHVNDSVTSNPISGATVNPDPRGGDGSDPDPAQTGANGIASFTLDISGSETYDIEIHHPDYNSKYPKKHISSSGTVDVYETLIPK